MQINQGEENEKEKENEKQEYPSWWQSDIQFPPSLYEDKWFLLLNDKINDLVTKYKYREIKDSSKIFLTDCCFTMKPLNWIQIIALFMKLQGSEYKEIKKELGIDVSEKSLYTCIRRTLLGDLYELTGKSHIEHSKNSQFSCYLLVRNLITEEDFDHEGHPMKWDLKTIEEYEKPIKENSLWFYIRENDIKAFTALYDSQGFDLAKTEVDFNGYNFTIPGLACYFGSLDIIKFLIANDVFFDRNSLRYAVCSGYEEIVEYMMLQDYSFNDFLIDAIKWHQNKIAKWFYENCTNNSFKLTDCVFWFNTDMLLYFIDDIKMNINECDTWDRTCLHVAVEQDNTLLVRFLILRGIDTDIKDALAHKAIDYAKSKEMKEILTAH